MFKTKIVEKIKKTHFMSNKHFFENGAVYDIILKIILEPDRPQMTI
jgi:hypothetical protein